MHSEVGTREAQHARAAKMEGECNSFDRNFYFKRYFNVGVIGCVVFGMTFLLTLYRTLYHIKRKSRLERVAFHIVSETFCNYI